jgi:hypothetical protein
MARELLEGLLAGQHLSRLFGYDVGSFGLIRENGILILPVSQHGGVALRPNGGLKWKSRRIFDFKLQRP